MKGLHQAGEKRHGGGNIAPALCHILSGMIARPLIARAYAPRSALALMVNSQ
jgi:hypothetical protein